MRTPRKPPNQQELIKELDQWVRRHARSWEGVKGKALKAYLEGEHIDDICKVLGISRQAFWKWRLAVEKDGIRGLEEKPHTGRPTRINQEQQAVLREALSKSPEESGYAKKEWHGSLVQRFVDERFGVQIKTRQAQYWLSRMKPAPKPTKSKK